MASSALVCKQEGGLSLAFSRVPPSPLFSCCKLAGRGDSSLFLLQLGSGQTREKLPSPPYPHVCQIIHGISACCPGWGVGWGGVGWWILGSAPDKEGESGSADPAVWVTSVPFVEPSELVANRLCFFGQFFWVERSREPSSSFDPLPLPLATTPSL